MEKKAEPEEIPVKKVTPEERKQALVDGIKKTVLPSFIGAGFALLLFLNFGDAHDKVWFSVILLVVILSYYIQKLVYPLIGVKVKEFEIKDWLYVEFLVIIFLMVVWTLLLNQ
ncbi:MAG: hypothetical protein IBX39_01145 [Candidatus Methanoperedenaceae archaeon]|nr:hypothetical protein [Candidatus Methanoperedenaceae archaeon]MDW7726271.1 hypothetical protein [Candidatus Methanoperedens sp.]